MIREYNKNDIDEIIKLFHHHNELSEIEESEKKKELEEGAKILVYEDAGKIKGFCSLSFWENPEWGSSGEMIMSIEEDCDFEKVSNSLWESGQILLKEKEVVYLITHYDEKYKEWREFYSKKGFEEWFGVHGMVYKGGRCEDTKLTFRNYEEEDFHIYHTYLGKCFSEMREANDIRPFNLYENPSQKRIENFRKGALELKDSIYLFYDGEDFVGSSIIKQEEIDDLFVVPEFQGKGYGRKIMEATLNLALDRNLDKITLGVVAWNKVAYNLYKSLGFKKYRSFEHRRLILDKN